MGNYRTFPKSVFTDVDVPVSGEWQHYFEVCMHFLPPNQMLAGEWVGGRRRRNASYPYFPLIMYKSTTSQRVNRRF